jgi:hypothetical protein
MPGVGQPVPVRIIVFGSSSGSFEGIFELLEKVPPEVGANRYVTVQMPLGGILCSEQFSVCLLKGASGLVIVPITRFALPSFFTVIVWSGVPPTFTLPKGTGFGVIEISE